EAGDERRGLGQVYVGEHRLEPVRQHLELVERKVDEPADDAERRENDERQRHHRWRLVRGVVRARAVPNLSGLVDMGYDVDRLVATGRMLRRDGRVDRGTADRRLLEGTPSLVSEEDQPDL